MKYWLLTVLISNYLLLACSGGLKDEIEPNVLSSSTELSLFSLEYKQSVFNTSIDGNTVRIDRPIPWVVEELYVSALILSKGAKASVKIGDALRLEDSSIEIEVTAEDGVTTQTYSLTFERYDYQSIVEKHGRLQVEGNKIVGKHGQAVSLAGNSFFWSNEGWGGNRFYNASVVSWLKLDWGATIVRAAMGVDEWGGYLEKQAANKTNVKKLVDAAIEEGLYVIIDWHSHHAEDYPDDAVAFFKEMAQAYADYDNIIYEIYNEPLDVSWDDVIKPYAEKVIAAIREFDKDNLIVVGTPEWSQRVDLAAQNPITSDSNVAYVMHFYSVHHTQWLRDRTTAAIAAGLPIIVTEWGCLGYTQNDPETMKWMEWCKENQIIHCNWAVNDKEEEWSIVKQEAPVNGVWSEQVLTQSGKLARSIIRTW
ncbi:cellulase family glycosylhydrolase [Carboxylicivirga mesophila]|uniref:Cellulase family glycosylhydrolase n=1 Tax=Carboxylicivirga mesophila TaxID=1166478 RepID=A0ABS5KA92_9BACT|nr:cellulase family glycosylhydrolase [Carboxylicivirga mesophila]MBS2211426.1 cellulase family glycosylhydrolase [Carboxylicivirga mesophila]